LKFNFKQDLLSINIWSFLLIIIIFLLPTSVLRIILGLPFVLFFPGYSLIAALYPRQENMSGIGRIALSFGLSLAVVPLIGLALNYTAWGITLNTILFSQAAFIAAMSAAAWWKRRRLMEHEKFHIEFTIDFSGLWGPGVLNKVLSIGLAAAVLGTCATVAYVAAHPKTGEKFTEFYILNTEGKAEDYPGNLAPGETAKVTVGITNHEYTAAEYRVTVVSDNVQLAEAGPVTLVHDEKWENTVSFSCNVSGKQKVEFFIFRDKNTEPYLEPLRLWIDVKDQAELVGP
jgi:uncharacterized membrane protein